MSDDEIRGILTRYHTVAVVGLSRDPSKYSYEVADYLKQHGYHIVPVNPFCDEVLGEKCHKSLLEMPEDVKQKIEIVDIFRPSNDVPPFVEQAMQLKRKYGHPYVVWMQLGIANENAAESARSAGLIVIMDKCMMQEHRKITANV